MYIPKIRRISDVLKKVKEDDPKAEVSWYLVEQLILKGKLSARKFGDAWLINLDEFYGFFRAKGKKK